MKRHFVVLLMSLVLFSTAAASMLIPASEKAKEHAKAPEKSPAIGDDWELERVDFIHYAKPGSTGKPAKPPKQPTCYSLMGVKWKTLPVDYAINPGNSQGLSESFILSAFSTAAETWDDATSAELFSDIYAVDYTAAYGVYDYKNSIEFGPYSDPNVIAVTSVWYTRKGKQIVEFDQLYNTHFMWGDATINPTVMDLQNIAVHELGHAVGMDDIYSDSCSMVTMYGYSYEGDIEKRTLEQPDITGLHEMYGP